MSKIRILFYGLSDNLGGIERQAKYLLEFIDKSIFHIDFIDTNVGKSYYQELFESKYNSKFFQITPRKVSIRKNLADLKDLFRNNKFDIIHYSVNTLSYIMPLYLASKYNVKIIIHSRSSKYSRFNKTFILHYINYHILKYFKLSYTGIAVSENAKWAFPNKSDYTIIHNSIEFDSFRFNIKFRKKIREYYKISDDIKLIGQIGALLPHKNHLFSLKILSKLVKKDKSFRMIIIGSGNQYSKIISSVKRYNLENYIFLWEPNSRINRIMSALDYHIMPSKHEGFGNVLLEAQVNGLKSIVSNNITRELNLTDAVEYLSLSDKPEKWAKKILTMKLIHPRESYVNLVKEKWNSLEEQTKKIEQIYSSLSKESSSD